ncbi:hypothetical protein PILCRDRAFT_32698, partial [Piloderma croceum F 1598]
SSCLPNTRTGVLQKIREWVDEHDSHPICWLTGVTGSGKSTIAQTLAKDYAANGTLAGSIFFLQAGTLRISTARFFLTLAYQLAVAVPSVQALMQKPFKRDPSFSTKRLEDHFTQLIYDPLVALKQPISPMIVIVDALNESEDKDGIMKIIKIISKALRNDIFRLRFFFTSRESHHLETQFRESTAKSVTTRLVLENWDAHSDIRVFLQFHLHRVRKTKHRLMMQLPELWPSTADLDELVSKSEGSFIWASTLVKFVDDGIPHDKLQSALNAHAGLDLLYCKCASPAIQQPNFLFIMGNILLLRTPLSIRDLGLLIGLRPDEIIEPLQGNRSILVIPHDNNQAIRPFHASLRDFFMDRNRSKGLFIDPAGIHFGLVLSCITTIPKCLSENGNQGDSSNATVYAFSNWCYHLNLTL